jgi:hypothetical protein
MIPEERTIFEKGKSQFASGGRAACTSISFVSVLAMRERKGAREIVEDINWDRVVTVGVDLWKHWLYTQHMLTTDRFQSVEQIRCIPLIKEFLYTTALKGKGEEFVAEFGGNIDGYIPPSLCITEEDYKDAQETYPSLVQSCLRATSFGRGTVAIVTIEVWSVSMWTCGDVDGVYVIYDSHGTLSVEDRGTLVACRGLRSAISTLLDMARNRRDKKYSMFVIKPFI